MLRFLLEQLYFVIIACSENCDFYLKFKGLNRTVNLEG